VIIACILLCDGMDEMISNRINALFDLFDFNTTGNVSLDALNILLVCLTKALAAILNKSSKINEQHIIDYSQNIFEVLERNLYDDQELISKQEFHDYAQETWEGLQEPELSCLFTLFSPETEGEEQEGGEKGVEEQRDNEIERGEIEERKEKENMEVVNIQEETSVQQSDDKSRTDSKSHAEAAHSYANENKDAITELQRAAKKYNDTLQIALKAKEKYLSSSVDSDLEADSQTSLVIKLKAFQLMELALDKLHEADTKFRKWLLHHEENKAPDQLMLALQKYHDDRLRDIKEVERVFSEAKESGIAEELKLLETLPSEVITAACSGSSIRDDSSVVTEATGSTLAKIVSASKQQRPSTRESEYTDASYTGSEASYTGSEETDGTHEG